MISRMLVLLQVSPCSIFKGGSALILDSSLLKWPSRSSIRHSIILIGMNITTKPDNVSDDEGGTLTSLTQGFIKY